MAALRSLIAWYDPNVAALATLAIGLLPLPLLLYWRRQALARAHDPERPALFEYGFRAQCVLLVSLFFMPWLMSRLLIARVVTTGFARAGLGYPLAPWLANLAPTILQIAGVAIVGANVTRRLRGDGAGPRSGLVERFGRFAPALVMLVAMIASIVAIRLGHRALAQAAIPGGFVFMLVVMTVRRGPPGFTTHAQTVGPLRDRVFALAAQAGVTLKQVYVLTASGRPMANAFAVNGGKVLVTDQLLGELSQREVAAVLAHEIGHLKHRHPRALGIVLLVGPIFGMEMLGLRQDGTILLVSTLASFLGYLVLARQFEYVADRDSAELTNDAEALITALVRIGRANHVPARWSRARELLLTHPSTERRALALARAGKLDASRVPALLGPPAPAEDHWPVPAASRESLFGTPVRSRLAAISAWGVLGSGIAAAAAWLAALALAHDPLPRLVAFAVAVLAAFLASLFAVDALSARGYAAIERRWKSAGRPSTGAWFVGLSPGSDVRVYEGSGDWDVGNLALSPGRLEYRGELTSFDLARERVSGISIVPGAGGWIPTSRVIVEWLDDAGEARTFSLRDTRIAFLHQSRARAEALARALEAWRTRDRAPWVPSPHDGAPPDPAAVTGTPIRAAASPRTLVTSAILLAPLSAFVGSLFGLPLLVRAGIADVYAAAFLAVVLLRLPLWFAKPAAARPAATPARRAA